MRFTKQKNKEKGKHHDLHLHRHGHGPIRAALATFFKWLANGSWTLGWVSVSVTVTVTGIMFPLPRKWLCVCDFI